MFTLCIIASADMVRHGWLYSYGSLIHWRKSSRSLGPPTPCTNVIQTTHERVCIYKNQEPPDAAHSRVMKIASTLASQPHTSLLSPQGLKSRVSVLVLRRAYLRTLQISGRIWMMPELALGEVDCLVRRVQQKLLGHLSTLFYPCLRWVLSFRNGFWRWSIEVPVEENKHSSYGFLVLLCHCSKSTLVTGIDI